MAEAKTRIFTKKGPDGKLISREVTGAASEVEALFDGFLEQPASKTHTTATTGGAGKSAS